MKINPTMFFLVIYALFSCNNSKKNEEIKNIDLKISQNIQSYWLESEKQEIYTELNPIIEYYGILGQEFADILVKKISDSLTPTQYSDLSETELNKIFNQALMETKPGWTNKSKENFINSCYQNLASIETTTKQSDNIYKICKCTFNKIIEYYPNPLIGDLKSQQDTIVSHFTTKCLSEIIIQGIKNGNY